MGAHADHNEAVWNWFHEGPIERASSAGGKMASTQGSRYDSIDSDENDDDDDDDFNYLCGFSDS